MAVYGVNRKPTVYPTVHYAGSGDVADIATMLGDNYTVTNNGGTITIADKYTGYTVDAPQGSYIVYDQWPQVLDESTYQDCYSELVVT